MGSTSALTSQLYSAFSDISHPIEGIFYLFLLAVIFRWRWPNVWNNFLESISAPIQKNLNQESNSQNLSTPTLNGNNAQSHQSNEEN